MIKIKIRYQNGSEVSFQIPVEKDSELEITSNPSAVGILRDDQKAFLEASTKISEKMLVQEINTPIPVSHEEEQQKEPVVELHEFQFVCDNGSFYSPAKTLVDDFVFAFGREQVRRVFLTAKAWLMANPGKRKTARGMGRFLNAWLCRESGRERTALKQLNQGLLSNGKESAEGW